MKFKFRFLSSFRELLIPHHRSLEFRAKVLAAILCVKKIVTDNDYDNVKKIAVEIYGKDAKRIGVLSQIVKEYINRIKVLKNTNIDELLKEIDNELKAVNRYYKKIDFEYLRMLMTDSDEEDILLQQRVYEYMVSEVKIYSKLFS